MDGRVDFRCRAAALAAVLVFCVANPSSAGAAYAGLQLMASGGEGVAASGKYFVIGNMTEMGTGTVSVYRDLGGPLVIDEKILPTNVLAGERFGSAVAIDGRWLAVMSGHTYRPEVHLYQRRGGSWQLRQRFTTSQATGWVTTVALRGRLLLVGAAGDHEAHLYRRKGATWKLEATLSPSDPEAAFYATSVAIAGPKWVVVDSSGAAFVYRKPRKVDPWTEYTLLDDLGKGSAVAADGDRIVVGGYPDNHAQVFRMVRGVWNAEGTLASSDSSSVDGFAAALAIDGDRVAVAAIFQNGQAGAVYVFRRGPSGWQQEAKLTSSTPSYQFGNSVSIAGNAVLVGSWGSGAWYFK